MSHPSFTQLASELRVRNDALVAEQPGQRARNLAQALDVSEAQWIAAECNGVRAIALTKAESPKAVFQALGELGEVMALTRNEWCVHERHGCYETIQAQGHVGLVLGPDIDLRAFLSNWATAWAVEQDGRHSIQFFDHAGVAIHKVYRTEATDVAAYDALVHRFAGEPVWPEIKTYPANDESNTVSDPESLRTAWRAMQDTHDFFPLLRKFKVSRLAALRAAGTDLAQQVETNTAERMLHAAAKAQLPIMCFVGNRGMIQIHTGTVTKLLRTGPWFNVLDPKFNLHLNTEAIDSAWVVSKPTNDGCVTSLEVYAANGELIVQFFGERKPGIPEIPAWRTLLSDLCAEPLTA